MAATSTYECFIEFVVRGHHVCKTIWNPIIGEILVCEQEENIGKDSCAVADMLAGRCYCWPCPRRFKNMLAFLRKT